MDFAPDLTGVGGGYYERYVSESESTDGEGDASGGGVGQRSKKRTGSTAPHGYYQDFGAAKGHSGSISSINSSNVNGGYLHKQRSSSSSSSASIFAKLAASWSRGASKDQGETVRGTAIDPHRHTGAMAWRDVQEGDPTAYSAAIDGGAAEGSSIAQVVRCVCL